MVLKRGEQVHSTIFPLNSTLITLVIDMSGGRSIDATSIDRPPLMSITNVISVESSGKMVEWTCSPRFRTISPASSSTIVPNGSISARASRVKVEQAIAGKGLVGLAEFVRRNFCHDDFLRARTCRYERGPTKR